MPQAYKPSHHGFRTFLILWASQFLSVFGGYLTFFSITVWLTTELYPADNQKTDLSFALAAIGLIFAFGTVLVAPIAGTWADRHDRRRIMLLTNGINAVSSLTLLTLVLTHSLNLLLIIIFVGMFEGLGQFYYAAFESSYGLLVSERQMPRVNGMVLSMYYISGVLSPVVASSLIALPALARQGFGPGWVGQLANGMPIAIGLDVLTYLVAFFALLFLNIPNPTRLTDGEQVKPSLCADAREGFLYIWRRRPLLWLSLTGIVLGLVSAPVNTFGPLLVRFNLGEDWKQQGLSFETAYGLLGTASSLGGVVGSLLISFWGGLKKRRVYGLLGAALLMGLTLFVYGLSTRFWLTAVLDFIYTGLGPISMTHNQAIWQAQTPPELQGRVFAIRRLIGNSTLPVGTVLAGLVGGFLNPGWVLSGLGLFLALYALIQLGNPAFRRVEDREYLEKLAARGEPN